MMERLIKGYCIADRQGIVYPSTFRELRKDCISMWKPSAFTWEQLKEYGWKTVKCELTIKNQLK